VAQLESFASYFARLITLETFVWISFLMVIAFLARKPLARALQVSINRYLLIALSFAGIVGLSLRFWIASGTLSTFWLIAPELWEAGLRINANFVLNILLYIPPAILLVLARKSWWKITLGLFALSFASETIQQYARIGSGDPMDLFANFLGALLGVAIGLALVKLKPSLATKPTE